MNVAQAPIWNMRTYDSDEKGNRQAAGSCERDSTDAEYRGGTIRSSEELSVMERERRDCIIQFYENSQPEHGRN